MVAYATSAMAQERNRSMNTMTRYQTTKAFLIALELDTAQRQCSKAIRQARQSRKSEAVLKAMKARDELTREYQKVTGVKQ